MGRTQVYFVDVITEQQKDVLAKMLRRSALPMTACYKDNNLSFVRLGQLFDTQMKEIMDFLKPFGDKPLTKADITKRLEEAANACKLTFYIFTQTTTSEEKQNIINKCYEYHELPIDVDSIGTQLDKDTRIKIFKSQFPFAKLVIFKDGKSNAMSSFGQAFLLEFANMRNNANPNFEVRMIPEVLK